METKKIKKNHILPSVTMKILKLLNKKSINLEKKKVVYYLRRNLKAKEKKNKLEVGMEILLLLQQMLIIKYIVNLMFNN